MAYANIMLLSYNQKTFTCTQTVVLMLLSGIFWEFITPLFRKNIVTDVWDIVAYIIGGLICWWIIKWVKLLDRSTDFE